MYVVLKMNIKREHTITSVKFIVTVGIKDKLLMIIFMMFYAVRARLMDELKVLNIIIMRCTRVKKDKF
jgi:hypothetical protein